MTLAINSAVQVGYILDDGYMDLEDEVTLLLVREIEETIERLWLAEKIPAGVRQINVI